MNERSFIVPILWRSPKQIPFQIGVVRFLMQLSFASPNAVFIKRACTILALRPGSASG